MILIDVMLDRKKWGIIILPGFRCKALKKASHLKRT